MAQENLSALMDGECSEAELDAILAEFESSAEVRQRWSRMCAVRDALSDSRIAAPALDICGSVMAAIAAEPIESVARTAVTSAIQPAIAIPAAANDVQSNPGASKVVPFPSRPAAAARNRLFQPLVGLAAAASIAGALVLGGNTLLSRPFNSSIEGSGGGSPDTAANDRSSSDVAIAQKAGLASVASNSQLAESTETRWGQLNSEAASQLNGYMMEHSNYRAEQGMGGSLSYARMAVRTADYRPASEQH
jgi:negative regulator of sigma E activity